MREFIGRLFQYARHHGLWGTVERIRLALVRMPTGNRQVLFYCDLGRLGAADLHAAEQGWVERISRESDLEARDLGRILSVGHPEILRRRLSARFARGASLWLYRSEDALAGYGWSLTGQTMNPHFFLLGGDDAHLFDFFVFPEHRGRRINRSLVTHILTTLVSERKARAFIEAAAWNTPQLHSLSRMPFQKLGSASMYPLFGRTIVIWSARTAEA